jgi:formylglycine-generating enzyme required for sulfatase activity
VKRPAFISYAREDSAFVLRLAGDLKARGADIWLDQLDIRPGQPWDREVERALTDCDEMLVILSPVSVESRNVMDEVAFALDEGKTVIPVLHRDCKLPLRIRRLHFIDLKSDYEPAIGRLVQVLAAGQQAVAATAAQGSVPTTAHPLEERHGLELEQAAETTAAPPPAGVVWFPWRTALVGAAALAIILTAITYQSDRPQPTASSVTQAQDQSSTTASAASGASATRVNPRDGLTYVWIPPGRFMMGCSSDDSECNGDEKRAREVAISKGFWIGRTEVTQEAYQHLIGSNPSRFKGAKLSVENVSWNDPDAYCQRADGRLPTEAEWEYAARAGSAQSRYGDLAAIAWYEDNSAAKTHGVAQKIPNAWGLYDMLGNVWEWVADWYAGSYQAGAATDPRGPAAGQYRTLRGGSWYSGSREARVSSRDGNGPGVGYDNYGFRCAGN